MITFIILPPQIRTTASSDIGNQAASHRAFQHCPRTLASVLQLPPDSTDCPATSVLNQLSSASVTLSSLPTDPDFARMDSQQPSLPLTGANSASGSAPLRLLAPERQPESFLSLSDSLSSAFPHSTVSLYTTTDYSTSQGTLNLHTFSMPSPRPLHTSAQPPSEDTDESSYSPSLLSTSSAVRPWSFYQRDPFADSDEGLIDSGAPDGGALFAEPSLVAEGERLKELFVPFGKEVQGSVVQSLRDSLYGGSAVAEVDDVWLAEDQTQPRGAEEDGEEEEEIDHDRMVPTDGHRLAAKVSYAPLPSTSRGGAFAMLAERLEQKAQGNQSVPCPQIELYSYETQWSRSYDPPPSTGTGDQDSLRSTTGETTLMGDEGKFGYVGDYQGTGRGHALPRWRIVTALSLAVVFMFWTLAATISCERPANSTHFVFADTFDVVLFWTHSQLSSAITYSAPSYPSLSGS